MSEEEGTTEAMRAHLLPILECMLMIIRSSSAEKGPFLRLGRRWFAHLSLQLLPLRASLVIFWTLFQFPSLCFLTYSINIASSVFVHGPFFFIIFFHKGIFLGMQLIKNMIVTYRLMLDEQETRKGRVINVKVLSFFASLIDTDCNRKERFRIGFDSW